MRGQTLLEVIIALAVGALLIGGAVLAIGVMLRVGGLSRGGRAASLIGSDLRRRVEAFADSSWQNLRSLPHGSGEPHYLVPYGTSFLAVKGEEGVPEHDAREGLLGQWGFDEAAGAAAYDSVLPSHTGTLTGGVTRATGCYMYGCLLFDGVDGALPIVDAGGVDLGVTDEITVLAWVKLPAISAREQCVLCWAANGGTDETADGFLLRVTALNEWAVQIASGGVSQTVKSPVSSGPFPLAWSHIAFTRDISGVVSLYVNGEPVPGGSSPNPFLGFDRVKAGGRVGGGDYLNGWVDDVRVYRRALAAEEIRSLRAGKVFGRSFYLENVLRDVGGAISSAGAEDPTSQKATVAVRWQEQAALSSLLFTVYLTQWDNGIFVQSDWSRGAGPEGPFTDSAQGFVNSMNVDVLSPVGSLRIEGF